MVEQDVEAGGKGKEESVSSLTYDALIMIKKKKKKNGW